MGWVLDYQERVLGGGLRLAAEAASGLGWHRWTGDRGDVLALDRFGISGSGEEVLEGLGFTSAAIAQRLKALVRS